MWFEIAIVALLLLLGQILFGHFEEKTPRWRKLLKSVLSLILFVTISYFFGRFWFFAAMVIAIIPVLYLHVWWLPSKGINGWTAEPREKYYELRGWKIDEKK
jgi:uncharacterized membrane protein YoaK (UPF0700 family)